MATNNIRGNSCNFYNSCAIRGFKYIYDII
ncbi:MAG: hypothetical protein KatS3mg095_0441 [Candidatus Parcubacteria bacterium]|nr:MAG: hypothetical protein KatS3mg095_0441 [Candidatus Parcubacteria bacterium]